MFKKLMICLLSCVVLLGTTSDLEAKGKSYSSGRSSSSSKFSGRSFATKPAASKPPAYKAPAASKPAASAPNKKYSSGNSNKPPDASNSPVANKPAVSNSRKPESSTFNNSLSNSAKQEESQRKFEAAKPKTYTPPGSKTSKPISPTQSQTVRKYVTHERHVTYENRSSTFYRGYQPHYYNDCFSPFLMGWILSDAMNTHDRAAWMYHHQSEMDQARYREMLSKDAKLQAEIDQLKAQNVKPDSGYIPTQMAENPDLMFNKEFVDASVAETATVNVEKFIGSLFAALLVISIIVIAAYFFFIKEY